MGETPVRGHVIYMWDADATGVETEPITDLEQSAERVCPTYRGAAAAEPAVPSCFCFELQYSPPSPPPLSSSSLFAPPPLRVICRKLCPSSLLHHALLPPLLPEPCPLCVRRLHS